MSTFYSLVEKLTKPGSDGIPAVSALTKNRSGKSLLEINSGCNSLLEDAQSINHETIFRLASSTKLVTAIAALQCVERGLITLDEPIRKWMPEFQEKQIITMSSPVPGEQSSPTARLDWNDMKKPITLRHLLTHTSGIGYDMLSPALTAWRTSTGETPKSINGHAKGTFDAPLVFEPGTDWMYGASYDVTGVLVAQLNGLEDVDGLEVYMQKHIFEPLGLKSPTFFVRRRSEEEGLRRLVQCVTRDKVGNLTKWSDGLNDDAAGAQGGDGLYCSAKDFVAILVDLLQEKPTLLRREMVDLMFEGQLAEGSGPFEGLMKARYIWGGIAGEHGQEARFNHSLGALIIQGHEADKESKQILTWFGGLGTWWMIDRKKGIAAFLGTQVFPPSDTEVTRLREAFLKEIQVLEC